MSKPRPKDPIALRPSNVDSLPEPQRTYEKAHRQQPFELEERRASFKRNRERVMRQMMKGIK